MNAKNKFPNSSAVASLFYSSTFSNKYIDSTKKVKHNLIMNFSAALGTGNNDDLPIKMYWRDTIIEDTVLMLGIGKKPKVTM